MAPARRRALGDGRVRRRHRGRSSAVGNSLRLDALPSLTTIGLDSLSSIAGCLTITNNPSLPTCQATTPRMRLEEIGWMPCGSIADNLVDDCSAGP
jgi:hypothetical protein